MVELVDEGLDDFLFGGAYAHHARLGFEIDGGFPLAGIVARQNLVEELARLHEFQTALLSLLAVLLFFLFFVRFGLRFAGVVNRVDFVEILLGNFLRRKRFAFRRDLFGEREVGIVNRL